MDNMFSSLPGHVDHPMIGTIRGVPADGVVQFLGIKYATLLHWFDNAQLVTYDGSGLVANQYGPQAISDPAAVDKEHQIIQKAIPKPDFPGVSGTECLTMNITVPAGVKAADGLPVLVYMHGGGFAIGSNWWPQFDMKRIVRLSVKQGNPVVGANINYRLGAPGFLTSEELRAAGFNANRGLHDQRAALRWLKSYVSGFGGDAQRMTVSGESIGGLSAARLVYSDKESLASRVLVLGGAPPSMGALPLEVAELTYQNVIEALGVKELAPSERVKALTTLPIEDLLSKISQSLPLIPTLDRELVPYTETYDLMASESFTSSCKSCEAMMIVYSQLDSHISSYMGLLERKSDIAVDFAKSIQSSLSGQPDAAEKILQIYGITPKIDDDAALIRILHYGGDIGYRAAARKMAEAFPKDAFVLQFAEANPWDGPFKGHSTHILDVAFMLQNYNDYLDEKQRASAVKFAEVVIAYVYGREPWKKFQDASGLALLRDGEARYVEGPESTTEEFDQLLKVGESVGLDTLFKAWQSFLFPR